MVLFVLDAVKMIKKAPILHKSLQRPENPCHSFERIAAAVGNNVVKEIRKKKYKGEQNTTPVKERRRLQHWYPCLQIDTCYISISVGFFVCADTASTFKIVHT